MEFPGKVLVADNFDSTILLSGKKRKKTSPVLQKIFACPGQIPRHQPPESQQTTTFLLTLSVIYFRNGCLLVEKRYQQYGILCFIFRVYLYVTMNPLSGRSLLCRFL
ncbi:MAG: hypothetical protein CSA34_07720 [Desulfobulbus propionicus]|nr:MAG: hypothetical protein CSA34_07720 [Desulfobulbus propionicus]